MEILTQKQFAEKIGVTRQTVHKWDKQGLLPARKTITGKSYYTDEDVERYYKGGEQDGNNSNEKDNSSWVG